MQNALLQQRLRKPGYLASFVLAFTLALIAGRGPVEAALYTDTFSAAITSATHAGTGYNPYGLNSGMTFNWSMTFDTNTIPFGVITFSGYYPSNHLSFAIPKSGSVPQILTEKMDYSYGAGQFNGAWGYFSPGGFNPTSSRLQDLFYGGDNDVCTLNFFTNTSTFELFFSLSNAAWSLFTFNPGLDSFDPLTDRHSAAPIPGALVLLGSGVAALAILKRRQGA
jgi:hypothetical protein